MGAELPPLSTQQGGRPRDMRPRGHRASWAAALHDHVYSIVSTKPRVLSVYYIRMIRDGECSCVLDCFEHAAAVTHVPNNISSSTEMYSGSGSLALAREMAMSRTCTRDAAGQAGRGAAIPSKIHTLSSSGMRCVATARCALRW